MNARLCPLKASYVMRVVAKAYGVTRDELLCRSRKARLAWPRQVAMALTYEFSGLFMSEIAELFERDRRTVGYALAEVKTTIACYPHTYGKKYIELAWHLTDAQSGR